VITQDINIHRKRIQKELYQKHCIGFFFIKPPGKTGYKYWDLVKYIISNWIEIKDLSLNTNKPFAYECPCRGKIRRL
jgi:hypothetical protein